MALVSHLERHATSEDVLLVSSHVYMGFFMNYNRAPVQWYSLLSKQPDPSPDEVALLEQVVRRHRRVWLAIDRVPSLGLPRPAEKWLTQHAYKLDEQVFSDYCRLCLYTTEDLPDPQVPQHATHLDLGHGVGLVGYDMNTNYPLTGMPRRSELRFSLLWEATAVPDGDFKAFVQLLNAQGQLVWQTDRQPADGFRPTREWRAGERIRDSYGLRLPGDLPAGHYRLIAGMYDPLTLKRLPMTDSAGADAGDYLQLAEMTYLS